MATRPNAGMVRTLVERGAEWPWNQDASRRALGLRDGLLLCIWDYNPSAGLVRIVAQGHVQEM